MKIKLITLIIGGLISCSHSFGQNNKKPYKCGSVPEDFSAVKSNYDNIYKYLGVSKGENVASIGVSNGYLEVNIAAFVDSVNWTLQDIDSTCLNQIEFNQVLNYFEKLNGKPIKGEFSLIVGEEEKTNLLNNNYDRILLVNVFHELTNKEAIMKDISELINSNGEIVISENIAKKKGQLHNGCGHVRLYEPDFLMEMQKFNFRLIKETADRNIPSLKYYTFKKA